MKKAHQVAIKYLAYILLNKLKLDNKQPQVPPPLLPHIEIKDVWNSKPTYRKDMQDILSRTKWTRNRWIL